MISLPSVSSRQRVAKTDEGDAAAYQRITAKVFGRQAKAESAVKGALNKAQVDAESSGSSSSPSAAVAGIRRQFLSGASGHAERNT